MMSDPIADMLTRIRNAGLSRKAEVLIPWSKMKFHLAEILAEEGYIALVEKLDKTPYFRIRLKYDSERKPYIRSIQRVSRPGKRIYTNNKTLPKVLNGLGAAVISTSKGLMTNKKARKESLGGEVICEVY